MNRRDAENAENAEIPGKRIEPDVRLNALTDAVIGAAIEVHRALGPGYLESVYEEALTVELPLRDIAFERQYRFETQFEGHVVGSGRIDFLVDDPLVVGLKSIDVLLPIHQTQVISYLRGLNLQVGLLLNFNVPALRSGIRIIVCTK